MYKMKEKWDITLRHKNIRVGIFNEVNKQVAKVVISQVYKMGSKLMF